MLYQVFIVLNHPLTTTTTKNNSKTKIIQIPKEKVPKPNKINILHLFIISITRELRKHFLNACIVRTLQVEMFSFGEAIQIFHPEKI